MIELTNALSNVTAKLRTKLIQNYLGLRRDLVESRYDAAGLKAGKLCEVVLRILQEKCTPPHVPFGTQIQNFPDACRRIIDSNPTNPVSDSEKKVIPRALSFLYTMRNTRGIGHVGGDVDANIVDSRVMGATADWIVCELIRVYHKMSLEEAQDIVNRLAVRRMSDIWEVDGKVRVLNNNLTTRDKCLLILYSKEESVLTEDLISWVEYSSDSMFKKRVLSPLHSNRLVEWNKESETVTLSPKGISYVENILLKSME